MCKFHIINLEELEQPAGLSGVSYREQVLLS